MVNKVTQSNDEMVVYKPWPVETIRQAYEEFRDAMYGGAGAEELISGLLCMEFLTRASYVPEPLATFVSVAKCEAEIRISLILQKEAADSTEEENWKRVEKKMQLVVAGAKSIEKLIERCKWGDPGDTKEKITKYIQYKLGNDK